MCPAAYQALPPVTSGAALFGKWQHLYPGKPAEFAHGLQDSGLQVAVDSKFYLTYVDEV